MNTEESLKDAIEFCHICEVKFKENDEISRDSEHFSRDFWGFWACAVEHYLHKIINVVFHYL